MLFVQLQCFPISVYVVTTIHGLYCCHQVDVFEVEAVSLGRVTHCIVGHDGDGIGEGWYLNEILVRHGPDATHEYVFPCCRSASIACTHYLVTWLLQYLH